LPWGGRHSDSLRVAERFYGDLGDDIEKGMQQFMRGPAKIGLLTN